MGLGAAPGGWPVSSGPRLAGAEVLIAGERTKRRWSAGLRMTGDAGEPGAAQLAGGRGR